MTAIFQTTVSNVFSWLIIYKFRLEFHWSLFPSVQLTTFQRLFRQWLCAAQATSHYLNQWWLDYSRKICVTRPQWVKVYDQIINFHKNISNTFRCIEKTGYRTLDNSGQTKLWPKYEESICISSWLFKIKPNLHIIFWCIQTENHFKSLDIHNNWNIFVSTCDVYNYTTGVRLMLLNIGNIHHSKCSKISNSHIYSRWIWNVCKYNIRYIYCLHRWAGYLVARAIHYTSTSFMYSIKYVMLFYDLSSIHQVWRIIYTKNCRQPLLEYSVKIDFPHRYGPNLSILL